MLLRPHPGEGRDPSEPPPSKMGPGFRRIEWVWGAALALIATPAFAHPGHDTATAFAGLLHPFLGADHILAMVAVGLWAALRGQQALWAWPAAFLAAMAAGAGLGTLIPTLTLAEPGIVASVIILGVLVAAAVRAPIWAGAVLIGVFGLAHGYAHAAEAPGGMRPDFAVGFLAATAALHLAGLGAGLALARLDGTNLIRLLGVGAALGGLALAFT